MSVGTDTRDKVVALERDVKHLTEQVEAMADKVSAMHDLLMQARGARWAILAMAAIGGFVSAKLAQFFPWFGTR